MLEYTGRLVDQWPNWKKQKPKTQWQTVKRYAAEMHGICKNFACNQKPSTNRNSIHEHKWTRWTRTALHITHILVPLHRRHRRRLSKFIYIIRALASEHLSSFGSAWLAAVAVANKRTRQILVDDRLELWTYIVHLSQECVVCEQRQRQNGKRKKRKETKKPKEYRHEQRVHFTRLLNEN